jgi:hypothetical protein
MTARCIQAKNFFPVPTQNARPPLPHHLHGFQLKQMRTAQIQTFSRNSIGILPRFFIPDQGLNQQTIPLALRGQPMSHSPFLLSASREILLQATVSHQEAVA